MVKAKELNLEIGKRIRKAINYIVFIENLTNQREVAELVGKDKDNLSKALKGDIAYTGIYIEAMCNKYQSFSKDWFYTGNGNMLKDSSERGGKNIASNHIGTFNAPINTQIGDNIRNVIGDDKPKKVQKSSDKEIKLEKENSTLKSEISELKMKILELSLQNEANNKLIEEKERLINVLLNQR